MHALLASTACWAFTPHTLSNNRLYVYSQLLSITPAHTLPRTLHGSQSLVRLLAERCSGRTLVFGWLTTSSTRAQGASSRPRVAHTAHADSPRASRAATSARPRPGTMEGHDASGPRLSYLCSVFPFRRLPLRSPPPSTVVSLGMAPCHAPCLEPLLAPPWVAPRAVASGGSHRLSSGVLPYPNQVLAKSRRSRGRPRPSARNAYFLVISV